MQRVPDEVVEASVAGASELERFEDGFAPLRIPVWTRAQQADRWFEFWAAHATGVRLRLRTAATRLRLDATITLMVPIDETAPIFPARVVADVGGAEVARAEVTGGPLLWVLPARAWRLDDGPRSELELAIGGDGTVRDVTVWLPQTGATLIHGLLADAPVEAAGEPGRPRWLHHGSSNSECLEAETPRQTWPQLAADALGLELDNFALAGNAQLDPFVARTLSARPADVISLKLGVNNVNADSMKERTFVPALHGFLDLVREGHPRTPMVVLTPVVSPSIEDTPGPTVKVDGRWRGTPRELAPGDGTLTLGRVRDFIRTAVEQRMATDDRLWFADGLELLGADDADLLWDNLHPRQPGYDLIAERFVVGARNRDHGIGRAFAAVLR